MLLTKLKGVLVNHMFISVQTVHNNSTRHPKLMLMVLQTLQTLPQTLIIEQNVVNSFHIYHYSGVTNHMQEKKKK